MPVMNAFIYSSGKSFVSSFIFSVVSHTISVESSTIVFFDKISLFELSEPVPYCGFKVVPLNICVQSVCVQHLCWESWVWYSYKPHLSSGCSGSSHLCSRLKYTCWGQAWVRSLPLLTGHHHPDMGLDPKFLEQNPWGVGIFLCPF